MSIIATALKHLIAAGVSGDDLVRAVAEMEAAIPTAKDPVAERRRAYDRERKRRKKSTGIPVEPVESAEQPPLDDIYSNPPENPDEANASSPPLHVRVVEVWNEMAVANGLRTSRKLNPTRLKHLAARVKQHGEEAVFEAIRAVALSDWHCGRKPGSDWKANLGWLLESPEKFDRLLEIGDSAKAAPPKPTANIDQAAYLASLAAGDKPWLNSTPRAEPERRNGSHSPPRSIGEVMGGLPLVPH